MIAGGLRGLLEGHEMIDRLWIMEKDKWKRVVALPKTIGEIRGLWKGLKDESFDLTVDLQGLLRSGLLTFASSSPVRVGFQEAREGAVIFYTHSVAGGEKAHAVNKIMKIAEHLGCDTKTILFPLQYKSVDNGLSFSKIHESISSLKDYAVIAPGARWETKRWPPERFGVVASMLPVRSVVIGSKSDITDSETVVSYSKGKSVSLTGETTLREMIEIIKKAVFMLTNDTGPMHIAAALDIPVFAVFGPTDPEKTGPYGEGHTIIKSNVDCSPCRKRTCRSHDCMSSLSVEEVYESIKPLADNLKSALT